MSPGASLLGFVAAADLQETPSSPSSMRIHFPAAIFSRRGSLITALDRLCQSATPRVPRANVWTSYDIQYAYHAASPHLPPIPAGTSFSISIRRMIRNGQCTGIAVEDVGIAGDDRYDMTSNELLHGNCDLAEFCTGLLTAT